MKLRKLLLCALAAAGCPAVQAADVTVNPDGTVALPYFEDFQTEEFLDLFDIVDANNDGRSWMYSDIVFDMRNRTSDDADADDWLFLPPMEMRAACSYTLTFSARAVYSMYTERLEVKAGECREADPDAMTITLIPATDVVPKTDMRAVMTVPRDGIYRIAFHAVSAAGAFRLAIDDVRVDAPQSALRPGLPTDGAIVPTGAGELSAKLAFRVPETAVNGSRLSAVTRVEVLRGGRQVFEIQNPVPGSLVERDVATEQGDNQFSVTAYNDEGEGETLHLGVFTGDDVPLPPSNLRMEVRNGKAYLAWDAPTEGENGGFIDPSALTYEIQRRTDFQYVETAYAGTEYVDVLPDNTDSRPRQLFYCVKAISRGGKSTLSADSNRYITGGSTEPPFAESFAGQNYDDGHYWHSINDGERWNLDGTLVFDGDGGAAKFAPANPGENSLFYTSRISLKNCSYPLLTFHYWHVKNSDMLLEVMVSRENGEFSTLRSFDFSEDGDAAGWKKGAVLLDGFTDAEYVLVGWRATAGMIQAVTALDAVNLRDVPRADLAVSLSVPGSAAEGQPVMMTATVTNVGALEADGFRVSLHHEALGKVAERECGALPLGQSVEVEFSVPFNPAPGLKNGAYEARVEWESDTDFSNDTDRAVVQLRPGRLPKPTGLTGEMADGTVTLRWDSPAMSGEITDDMEDNEPFLTTDFGDWVTIDRDRQVTYRVVMPVFDDEQDQISYEYLEYPSAGSPMAFQVFNPSAAGAIVGDEVCRSGDQVLACFSAVKGRNNDWLISPELSGEAQTVRFHAVSAGDEMWGQEKIEVYWSDRLQEPELFTQVLSETSVPNGRWTEFSVDLPAGAKHFAIRCVSEIVMALFIDDVTYTPKDAEATLTGYEVLRDGAVVAAVPAGQTHFSDQAPADGSSYRVRAVYEEGVSPLSSAVAVSDLGGSGIDSPHASEVSVAASPGRIEVAGDATLEVTVYSLAGTAVAAKTGAWRISVDVASGIYIIE
ncbi:MAG: choice-of-anchor J domain-containing protein, partial [Muribaculaceae bacterium]|nr:choice-of-anchor J domain-containing protein [Muribaculaceae bacterium]